MMRRYDATKPRPGAGRGWHKGAAARYHAKFPGCTIAGGQAPGAGGSRAAASAVVSAYFGHAVAPNEPVLRGLLQGALTSLLIATPIVFFEVRRARLNSLGWMRRLPLAGYFIVKVVF